MHRYLVIFALFCLVAFACMVSGCVTTPAQPDTRADILRTLDGAEIALSVALGLAEMHGADPDILSDIRTDSMLAFDAARAAVSVDLSDVDAANLADAIDNINTVTDNVLTLCERVGLSETRTATIRNAIDSALVVLRQVVEARG